MPWAQTIEVALILKELLDALGLVSFPKTSGGKGFHVLVPLDRRSTFEQYAAFAELVAGAIARAHPKLATTEWSKARRRGVLIDSNQNGEGKTIASVYSVRPKPNAPVSTPLRWDEVDDKLNPSIYTMPVVLERVRALGDLYAGLLTTRQSLVEGAQALWNSRPRARRLLRHRQLLAVDHRVAHRDRAQLLGGLLGRLAELRVERRGVVEIEHPRPERRQDDRDPRHEDRVPLQRRGRPLDEERDEDADRQPAEADRRDRLADRRRLQALHEGGDHRRQPEDEHRQVGRRTPCGTSAADTPSCARASARLH